MAVTESWDLCPSQELWAARGLHHHRKPVRTVGGLISTDGTDYALGVQTRSINPKDSVPFPILIRKEGVLNGGGGWEEIIQRKFKKEKHAAVRFW